MTKLRDDISKKFAILRGKDRLTSTWSVPLSLVRMWFVPLPVCADSQVGYFPPNSGGGYHFSSFIAINKQTNKQSQWGGPEAPGMTKNFGSLG